MMIKRILLFVGYNYIFFTCFLLGLVAVVSVFGKVFYTPADAKNSEIVKFLVSEGDNLAILAPRLYDEGLIKSPNPIRWFAILKGNKMKEKLLKLQEGEYELAADMTPGKILDVLTSGKVVKYAVTIPEGKTVLDIIRLIGKNDLIDSNSFAIDVHDREFIQSLGIFANSLEGYLFPETYHFTKPINAKGIITKLVSESKKRFMQDEYKRRMDSLGMSLDQALTLASIIEKESGNVEEMPTIASVFHNRLRLKMPLQSDPTVLYGIHGTIDGEYKITKDDLKRNTSYNTYVNRGLPPTPICNPGEAAFKAALFPQDTKYLYFVAKGDGSNQHVFSENYEDHRKAVSQYRRNVVINEAIAEIEAEEKGKQQELNLGQFKTPEVAKPEAPQPKKRIKIDRLISPIAPALNEPKEQKDEQEEILKRILN